MIRFLRTILKTIAVVATGLTTAVITMLVLLFVLVGIGSGIGTVGTGDSQKTTEYQYHYGDESSQNTFLSIPITGLILGDKIVGDDWSALIASSGVTYGYEVKEVLLEAAQQSDIAGVILEIDSPGGTIYGSKAITDGVDAYRKQTGKPVVAYIGGLAASGGYWAAVSADVIVADAGTGVGSIGVISGPFKYYDQVMSEDGGAFVGGVVTSGGVQTQYITAGEYKDMGNPYRQLQPEETATLQGMVNDSYESFVSYVAERRKLDPSVIRSQVKALLYGNEQAERLQLIDLTGSKQEAYDLLAARLQLENYQVKRTQFDSDFFSMVLGVLSQEPAQSTSVSRCPLSSHVLAYHGDLFALCR